MNRLPEKGPQIAGGSMSLLISCALCFAIASGCNATSSPGGASPTAMETRSTGPTPTIDIGHAEEALAEGGELTYGEILALRREMVGDAPNFGKINDADKYDQAEAEYEQREQNFDQKLLKCRLKQSIGWVAWWMHEYDQSYELVPDKYIVTIYLEDPFTGGGKDVRDEPDFAMVGLSDKQVAEFKYGQRIQFTGALTQPEDLYGSYAVDNPEYEMLADDPPAPTPTADDLKNLSITLNRTACFGACPEYTLTIDANGNITFEGRNYTAITGTATSILAPGKLVELAEEVEKADFFGLDNSYSRDVTDNPTYTLSVKMGGRSKQVSSYGTRPRRLQILMDRVDQIANTAQWIDTVGK